MASANENHARGAHEFTITPATRPHTRATRQTAGTCQELPSQGDWARGTPNLAFHARLIELALQAEIAAVIKGTADAAIDRDTVGWGRS